MTTQTLNSTVRCDTAIAHTPMSSITFRFKSAWVDEHAHDMAEYTTVKMSSWWGSISMLEQFRNEALTSHLSRINEPLQCIYSMFDVVRRESTCIMRESFRTCNIRSDVCGNGAE